MNKVFHYGCLALISSVLCACSANNGSINPKNGLPENGYTYDFNRVHNMSSGMNEISIYERWKGEMQRTVASFSIHDREITEETPKTVYFDSCVSMIETKVVDKNHEVISSKSIGSEKLSCKAGLTFTRDKNKIFYEGNVTRIDFVYLPTNLQTYVPFTRTQNILKSSF